MSLIEVNPDGYFKDDSCEDVTSGATCVVLGSRKEGVQVSVELSGCSSREEQLEAVAALSFHC